MSYGNYPDHQKIKKILVIKLRHLGDVLLTTPVFSVLKQHIPHAEIHAYVYLESKAILEGNPYLTKIIAYDRSIKQRFMLKKLYYEIKLLRQIRKEKYDLIINLTEGDRGAMATRVAKGFCRVGGNGKRRKTYTHLVKEAPFRHTVEKNLDAVRRIGIFPKEEEKKLYFPLRKGAFIGWGSIPQDFFLVHPTSRWRFKCWPSFKVRQLIEKLLQEKQNVVITSGKDKVEVEMVDSIVQGIKSKHLFNLSGNITIQELGYLIQKTKGLVCMDSFPFHISSVFQTPVVALFGPTSEKTWGPWQNPKAKIITKKVSCRPCFLDGCGGSKRSECLYAIEVDEVYEALCLVSACEKRDLLKR